MSDLSGCQNPPDWWNAVMMQSAECGECEYCTAEWTTTATRPAARGMSVIREFFAAKKEAGKS